MFRFPSFLFSALLVAAPFAIADDCAPAGPVEISITRSGQSALVTYRFDAPVRCLALNDRGDVRKLSWELQTPGAALSEDGNTVRLASPRKDFAVRVHAFDHDGAMDRVYSPLIAFGDHAAVAVYTSYLYPAVKERGVFISFSGFAPTASELPVGPQRIGIEQTYVVVGQPVVRRSGQVAAVIDQAMPGWLLNKVNAVISKGEAALHGVTPAARALTYMITYTEPGIPHATWRGDTLDSLVRLNFMGAPWQHDRTVYNDSHDQFILHELFHTAITPALNPRLPGSMSLSEGGAEAGAMAMRRRFAGAAVASMSDDIDNAIASCGELSGKSLADKEREGQRFAPYACGMALQFMVSVAVQRDPLDIWRTLLNQAKPLDAGWPAFIAAAAVNGRSNEDALAILGEMSASRIEWDDGMTRLASAGLVRRRTEAELAQPAYGNRYRRGVILHLLKQNCSERYGFNEEPSVTVLDAPAGQCGAMPDQFRLVGLSGINLYHNAYKAYRELSRRCLAGLPVKLADDQGRTREVSCKTPPKAIILYTLPFPSNRNAGARKSIADPSRL